MKVDKITFRQVQRWRVFRALQTAVVNPCILAPLVIVVVVVVRVFVIVW